MKGALDYLHSLTNFESHLQRLSPDDFHLKRVHELLDAVGDPQHHLNVIHVAGTKGKGSTCAMLASILQQAGFTVGLYTSPHLHRVNERIRVLGPRNIHSRDDFSGSISDEELSLLINEIRPAVAALENKGHAVTYFEVLTVIAGLYFARQRVDYVILETGLGGRLDATNAFESTIAVITPISLDHTRILGHTLKQIAAEKAGIIKSSRQRVVIAPQPPAALEVIRSRAAEFGIVPCEVHPTEHRQRYIALKGEHQLLNASCASAVVDLLNQPNEIISRQALEDGLKQVRWQGRFEVLRRHPQIVVDGAHNPASAEVLAKTVLDEYRGKKVILVLGLSSDKDIRGVCEPLRLISDTVILTKADHPRSHAFSRQEAGEIFAGKEWFFTEAVKDALELALSKASRQDVILITGSLFVVAQARAIIRK